MQSSVSTTRNNALELPSDTASRGELESFFTNEVLFKRVLLCPTIEAPYVSEGTSSSGFFFLKAPIDNRATTLNSEWWLQGLTDHYLDLGNNFVRGVASSTYFPRALFDHEIIALENRPNTFKLLTSKLGITESDFKNLSIAEPTLSLPKLLDT